MPEMSGLELCRKVRARGNIPYTYVILMTVKDLPAERLEGLQAGADAFLVKPVGMEDLRATIESAQRILSAQDELRRRMIELGAIRDDLERANAELAARLKLCELAGAQGN